TDAPKILADVVTLIGGEVPSDSALSFLGMATRKPANVPWRAAPADVTMRKLICQAIAADDDNAAQAAAEAIEQYIGDDPDRQAMIGNVAAVLLEGGTYRTKLEGPLVTHLERWRDTYDVPPSRRRAK